MLRTLGALLLTFSAHIAAGPFDPQREARDAAVWMPEQTRVLWAPGEAEFNAALEAEPAAGVGLQDLLQVSAPLTDRRVEALGNVSVWTPGFRSEAAQDLSVERLLSGYVNGSEHMPAGTAVSNAVNDDDPLLYGDPWLLSKGLSQVGRELIRKAFQPVKDADGQVRFSVFGVGSLSIERDRDARPDSVALRLAEEDPDLAQATRADTFELTDDGPAASRSNTSGNLNDRELVAFLEALVDHAWAVAAGFVILLVFGKVLLRAMAGRAVHAG
ncbi:MAG: hypothetical protein AAF458_18275 [Pseudomonadota bacterium]